MKRKIKNINDISDKKFIEVFNTDDWEVETDDGWKDIISIGKTIPYESWKIKLENGEELLAADEHIVIINNGKFIEEKFIKELNKGDYIVTKTGLSKLIDINNSFIKREMYDLEINSNSRTYFTNNILSHNSMWLGNMAAHSVYNGYNTAYITVELQREIIAMRIGSNMLSIPMDDYKEKSKDEDFMRKKLAGVQQTSFRPLGKFHIQEFPSSTLSVNDLRTYLKKAEEILGYKFENIFVDYINILKNWRNPNSENLYMKIKQISEDLRAMAMEEQWAVITATQTTRSGWDTSDLSIANVSESAALLHTVDALFGIIINPTMKAKGECYLKYLADRVSGMENTRKRYTFDRQHSRIEEDPNSQIEDLEYLFNTLIAGTDKKKRGGKPKISHDVIEAKISQYNPPEESQNIQDIKTIDLLK